MALERLVVLRTAVPRTAVLRTALVLLLGLSASLAHAQTCPYFAPGGALAGSSCTQQSVNLGASGFITNQLPLTALASIASPSFLGNTSGASGAPSAQNPLAVSTAMSAVLSVDVVSPLANLTLSGIQTIDGASGYAGEFVLAADQTTTSQNGIYVMAAGAWSRAANFPNGYVIGQNCEILISVKLGTIYAGQQFFIVTTGGPITIGTSAISVNIVQNTATATKAGIVTIGGVSGSSAVKVTGAVNTVGDCASFGGSGASAATILDNGNANSDFGLCATESQTTGHLLISNANGNFSSPTTNAGTVTAQSSDNEGGITGLSAATSVTITFGQSFTSAPACTATYTGSSPPTTPPYISAKSATAMTISFTALTGEVDWHCFGQK